MKKFSILFAALLTITVIFGSAVPVQAASTDVNIEIKKTAMDHISVTVPTTLPIVFNEDGTNTRPTNWTIENKSTIAGIHLAQVDLDAGESGWTLLAEYDDTKTMPVDTTAIKLSLGKEGALKLVTPTDGSEATTGTLIFQEDEIAIASGETQVLAFDVQRGAFNDSHGAGKAFEMVMTFEFN